MKIRVINAQVEPPPLEETAKEVEGLEANQEAGGKQQLVQELIAQYNSELETAMNYLAMNDEENRAREFLDFLKEFK